ncbi:hypothetical protein [Limnohabitans sp.]|uniref:hypothetical protein n=1 Tax=Limnohabitans sp. TaxID=1907725 RepID=UPI0035B4BBD7
MARWSIAALVVLNLALGAWNFGVFARWGWGPDDGREPERLSQQIRPEAITVRALGLTASAAAQPAASESSEPASAPIPNPSTRP